MVSTTLTAAESTKFALFDVGLAITEQAQTYIDDRNGGRAMTPADYASTSGVILSLPDDVWVNAPIQQYNPNFVTDEGGYELDHDGERLVVRGPHGELPAEMWLPPHYHGGLNDAGEAYNSYAFTHSDRVRISPIEGCSMTCKFCDLPYEFRYRTKRVEGLVDAVRTAVEDPLQPAAHVLISGGTPHDRDIPYVRDVYEAVVTSFPEIPVDIMMVPVDELMDPHWLFQLGVNELSINLEIFNLDLAHKIMRRKANQGRDHYLDYISRASEIFGPGKVRSMLMVGLESMEDTLAGVEAIAAHGGVPVLSPFRPDPATPLRDTPPPTAAFMEETYLRARERAAIHGVPLGPSCIPCSHNTITLATDGHGDAHTHYGKPHLI